MIKVYSDLSSNSQQAFSLFEKSRYGEKKDGKIIYDKYETVYLIEQKKAETDKKIELKKSEQNNYLVFKDLRKKGYIVKTGLKFGCEFRVYEKKQIHAKWLVEVLKDNQKLDIKNFISKNRIAHSTAKKLLLAVIDNQRDVTYLEVDWMNI